MKANKEPIDDCLRVGWCMQSVHIFQKPLKLAQIALNRQSREGACPRGVKLTICTTRQRIDLKQFLTISRGRQMVPSNLDLVSLFMRSSRSVTLFDFDLFGTIEGTHFRPGKLFKLPLFSTFWAPDKVKTAKTNCHDRVWVCVKGFSTSGMNKILKFSPVWKRRR